MGVLRREPRFLLGGDGDAPSRTGHVGQESHVLRTGLDGQKKQHHRPMRKAEAQPQCQEGRGRGGGKRGGEGAGGIRRPTEMERRGGNGLVCARGPQDDLGEVPTDRRTWKVRALGGRRGHGHGGQRAGGGQSRRERVQPVRAPCSPPCRAGAAARPTQPVGSSEPTALTQIRRREPSSASGTRCSASLSGSSRATGPRAVLFSESLPSLRGHLDVPPPPSHSVTRGIRSSEESLLQHRRL